MNVKHRRIDYVTYVENQRNLNDFNNRFNVFQSYDQNQYDDYRNNDDVMKTNDDVVEARSVYQNISSSRNQFFTFYQFRNFLFQNRAY